MATYYKRQWEEFTGDPLTADWGECTLYFETDEAGVITRQLEVYENGSRLKYDEFFPADDYGYLSDQPLDLTDFAPFTIPAKEFEAEWEKDDLQNEG